MSPLYLFNYIVLQWFFVRLAKVVEEDGSVSGWTIIFVWPLSGFHGRPYRYWRYGK